MKILELKNFFRGWFIGDFEPSILKTKLFEVGILFHKKDEIWQKHYHAKATEYNLLLKGKMTVNNKLIEENNIFIIDKEEISEPKFLEDCTVLVIKVPSVIGDKYEVI